MKSAFLQMNCDRDLSRSYLFSRNVILKFQLVYIYQNYIETTTTLSKLISNKPVNSSYA